VVVEGDTVCIDEGETKITKGAYVVGNGVTVDKNPSPGFETFRHINILQKRPILNRHVIRSVDIRSREYLFPVQAYIGLNGSSSSLHAEYGKALDLIPGPEEGLGKQDSGNDGSLSATTMESYFQHIL
jgi:hypothetical protein